MNQPLLSICIPTYNRADLLAYCMENLRTLDAFGIDYEIVVVDHASPDHTAQVVADAAKRWGNVRYFRQAHSVGIERQVTSCLRVGRGMFSVYVADDDKIIPDKLVEYVRYLKAHPEVSAVYCPWWAYDDVEEKIIHGYFEVPERTTFRADKPVDMLNFITGRMAWLESGVYRSEALHAILVTRNDGPYQGFMNAFALLRRGQVVFEKEPYYLEVANVKPQFVRASRMNVDINLSYLDNLRAGLELAVERLLLDLKAIKAPDEMRDKLHLVLLNYAHHRIEVASRRAIAAKQFPLASELIQRLMLWRGVYRNDLAQVAASIYAPAGLQAIALLASGESWLTKLYLHGYKQVDAITEIMRPVIPDLPIEAADERTILDTPKPESVMVVVKYPADRERFLHGGLLPGNVVALKDMADFYRVMPINAGFDDL